MKRLNNDPALAELPAPITLTPEQLEQVASDTGAMLGAGGGCIIIAGGIRLPPTVALASTAMTEM